MMKEDGGVTAGFVRTPSLGDGSGGTLVDTCSAVNAFSSVDDGDIVDGDSILGAHICACTACDTVVCNNLRHITPYPDFFWLVIYVPICA